MKFSAALPIFSAALAGTLVAQTPNIEIKYEKFQLDNGLTVIVHEDHKAPIVAINIWYHVGSKNEKPGKTGFAHLFEHLMFNGSENYNKDYFEVVERFGATNLNGTTSEDRTNYFQNVPVNSVDTVLWMESDRMGHLLGAIDQARLDEQRGVVQNEKRQGDNQPYGMVEYELINGTFSPGHPYSWSVIGSMDDLNAASLADVQEWFKAYYGPSNAVLVLAGDIDVKTAREKAQKYFGAIPPGPPVSHQRTWIAKRTGSHRQVMEDRVPQSRIYKVWNIPQQYSTDLVYLDLVSDVLGAGRTSRFYQRLILKDQLATDATASIEPREIAGLFHIRGTARPGVEPAQVEKALDEELAKFLADGPTADEVERVKTRYFANFVRGVEGVGGFGGKSDILAQGEVYAGNPGVYKESLELVSKATPEILRDVARRWLSDGVFALEVNPFPSLKATGADADRSKLPEPGSAPSFKMPPFQRMTMSNGLKVVIAERHEVPLVNVRLMFDAGYASDQLSAAGTAKLAMTMLQEGTKTKSSQQLAEQLDGLGTTLNAASGLDTSNVTMSALKAKLSESFDLFADVVLNPAFNQADFERQKRQLLAAIQREKNQPQQMALRVLPKIVFGAGHAYGNPMTGSGTDASVNSITRDSLARFHETWFKPNNATLIVVGDVTVAEIRPIVEKLFGGWQQGEVPRKNVATVGQQTKSTVYLIDRPGSPQSTILTGQVAPPRTSPDEIAMTLMNEVMGGAFISRINMNLREDKHWSYGAQSVLQKTQAQQMFLTIAPVQTDKTKESMAEVNKELHGVLRDKQISNEELARAKDSVTLSLPGSRERAAAVLGSIAEIEQYGLPQNYFETYTSKVQALTAADVNAAAERTVRPDNTVWVVVGDRAKIEEGVRSLNLGELKVIDPDGNPVN
jgi:zinc protease